MDVPDEATWQDIGRYFLAADAVDTDKQLPGWLDLYKRLTVLGASQETFFSADEPIIVTHRALRESIDLLWANPSISRENFETRIRENKDNSTRDMLYAVRIIVRLSVALDPNMKDNFPVAFVQGEFEPISWEPKESFKEFVVASVPKETDGFRLSYRDAKALNACELVHWCGITLEKTDILAEHLFYDHERGVIKVFHQVTWLKAQLQRHPAPITDTSLEESLNRRTLPPQLLLETLKTFYMLFPVATDATRKSKRLLQQLIDKDGFDPEAQTGGFSRWMPANFKYYYWSTRLQELAELAANPPPTSGFMYWVERHTVSNRSALAIALIGLFLTASFGLLSFLVGAAQLYLAWKAAPPA